MNKVNKFRSVVEKAL